MNSHNLGNKFFFPHYVTQELVTQLAKPGMMATKYARFPTYP